MNTLDLLSQQLVKTVSYCNLDDLAYGFAKDHILGIYTVTGLIACGLLLGSIFNLIKKINKPKPMATYNEK